MTAKTVEKIKELIAEKLQEEDFEGCYFLELEHPADNRLNIFLDSDTGISFTACRKMSRHLEAIIDEKGWMGEKYTLEVSSPGVDRPLKLKRQYIKNIGRTVEVKLHEGEEVKGKMIDATEEQIVVEYKVRIKEGKKKRTEVIQQEIPYENIKQTKVRISFK